MSWKPSSLSLVCIILVGSLLVPSSSAFAGECDAYFNLWQSLQNKVNSGDISRFRDAESAKSVYDSCKLRTQTSSGSTGPLTDGETGKPIQSCDYNGKFYANCEDARKQYQIDLDNYNKQVEAARQTSSAQKWQCGNKVFDTKAEADAYCDELNSSAASKSTDPTNDKSTQNSAGSASSLNKKGCVAAPDSPNLKITFEDSGPTFQITLSAKGEKASEIAWTLGFYSSEKQTWSWEKTEKSNSSPIVIEAGLQRPGKDYASVVAWAENACGASGHAYDNFVGASSGRSESINSIPLAKKVVDSIEIKGVPSFLRLNRGEYFLVGLKSKASLPMEFEVLTPLVCTHSGGRIEGISIGVCSIKVSSKTIMNRIGTTLILDVPVKDGALCDANRLKSSISQGKISGQIAIFKIRESSSANLYKPLILYLENVLASKTDPFVLDFLSNCPSSESISEVEGRIVSALEFSKSEVDKFTNSEKLKKENEEKAKLEAEAKAKAEAEAKAQASQSNSIVCVKGKSSLRVSGKNPKCPTGYKKK